MRQEDNFRGEDVDARLNSLVLTALVGLSGMTLGAVWVLFAVFKAVF